MPRNSARWLRRGTVLLTLLAALAGLGWAFSSSTPRQDLSGLLTHRVARGGLEVSVTEDGTLESSQNVEIKCKVKGGSTVLWVIDTGTEVKPGDVLVELDTATIEDNVMKQQIACETARANKIITEGDVAVAQTSITEYVEGTFQEERSTLQKEIFDAEEAVKKAQLSLDSATRLAAKGTLRPLQLEGEHFALESAQKDLKLKGTKLNALEKYTKVKMLQELQSKLQASEAQLASDTAALALEEQRLKREQEQLANCTIRAEATGMVIFPSAAEWKNEPDIEEGATVREQQTLLIIPDLERMQVKVGVHESKVGRLKVGMKARVQLQDCTVDGEVSEIAAVTRPSGWWTGNQVKYDTIVKLPTQQGLKPGMSAVVDIYLATHTDVLTVPVAAIVEVEGAFQVWVREGESVSRRVVELGDSDDEFTIVTSGLKEGDEVVLNPRAYIKEAQDLELAPAGDADEAQGDASTEDATDTKD